MGLATAIASIGGNASAFSPASLNPVLWLDPTNAASVTTNVGNVSAWADIAGVVAGLSFNQATAGRQPPYLASGGINGLASVQGTAVSLQGLTSTKTMAQILGAATSGELVVVAKLNADSVADPFGINWSTSDSGSYLEFADGHTYSGVLASVRNTGNAVSAGVLTSPFVWDIQSAANAYSILINWAVNFTTATNTFTAGAATPTLMNASAASMAGLLGEILVFPAVLASGDRTNLRAYLTAKWGTPSTIPRLPTTVPRTGSGP